MAKKAIENEELLSENELKVLEYNKIHSKSNKPALLTKKEKKELGIGRDQGKAIVKYSRISSRKVKIVLDLIKNRDLEEAYGILKFTPKAASEILYKLLKSAEANALNDPNKALDRDALFVSECYANQGPTLKRVMPRARGSANRIKKRTSHITLVLRERA